MRNLKRVLSLALALVMVLGMMVITTSAADYADADKITNTEAVAVLTGVGLFEGDGANFNPGKVLTRREAATLMTRILLGDQIAATLKPTKQIFTDVTTDMWGAAAIEYCNGINMIIGNGDGTFSPDAPLTGTAFAKLLLCALGYDAGSQGYTGSNWAQNVKTDALANDLIVEDVNIEDALSREDAAQMILQVLDEDMVRYINSYDYATGAAIVLGPLDAGVTFASKYYPTLEKLNGETNDIYGTWGRPYQYVWVYGGEEIYSVMKTPAETYTEVVCECDIAEDLGLKADAGINRLTANNVPMTKKSAIKAYIDDADITLLGTKDKVGAQGQLVEFYARRDGKYDVVVIDTFLAQVTDVTECTYDRNGHLDEKAVLTMDVYNNEDGSATEMTLKSAKDFENEANEWLLVYVNEAGTNPAPVIIGAPETLEGAQTAYTTVETHEVEDVEYDDAHTFYLDQAGNSTADHVWFFDQYDNLIGAVDIAAAPATYGVISSIYWKDSRDGENGYAYAKITYMDGEYEWKTVYSINNCVFEGVEGDHASIDTTNKLCFVSSTKQYNVDTYTNKALYELKSGKNGLELKTVTKVDGQLTTNQKTVVENAVYVNSKTMFLVWNSEDAEYEAYVGVKNLPNYKNDTIKLWVADVTEDTNAEYVFVTDPEVKGGKSDVEVVLYHATDVTVKTNLKNEAIVSYTIRGGNIGDIVIKAGTETDYTGNDLVNDILEDVTKKDGLMVLTIKDGVVTERKDVKTTSIRKLDGDLFVTRVGKLVADFATVTADDCYYEADDETLYVDGEWYDVADAELIGAASWKTAIKAGKTVSIVYDEDLVVTEVYFY